MVCEGTLKDENNKILKMTASKVSNPIFFDMFSLLQYIEINIHGCNIQLLDSNRQPTSLELPLDLSSVFCFSHCVTEKRQLQIRLVIVFVLAFCVEKPGEVCAMTMQLAIPLITSQEQPWLGAGTLLICFCAQANGFPWLAYTPKSF